MNGPFLDRVREAAIAPESLPLEALERAAGAISVNLSPERALTLVRLAHYQAVPAEAEAQVRARLNEEEPLIPPAGHQQMLALLAAQSLIDLFSRRIQDGGLVPALAIRCAAHAGWRPAHPDVPETANVYLARRAVESRGYVGLNDNLAKPKIKSEEPLEKLTEQFEYLRAVAVMDRRVIFERDRLGWWLASEARPASPLAIAVSFSECLLYVPEPPSTAEFFAAKLEDQVFAGDPVPEVRVPTEVGDLCANLQAGERESGEATVEELTRLLDQLLLARVLWEALR